jgi:hypothetical protein
MEAMDGLAVGADNLAPQSDPLFECKCAKCAGLWLTSLRLPRRAGCWTLKTRGCAALSLQRAQ